MANYDPSLKAVACSVIKMSLTHGPETSGAFSVCDSVLAGSGLRLVCASGLMFGRKKLRKREGLVTVSVTSVNVLFHLEVGRAVTPFCLSWCCQTFKRELEVFSQ